MLLEQILFERYEGIASKPDLGSACVGEGPAHCPALTIGSSVNCLSPRAWIARKLSLSQLSERGQQNRGRRVHPNRRAAAGIRDPS